MKLRISRLKSRLLKEERQRRKSDPRRRRLRLALGIVLLAVTGLALLAWSNRDQLAVWRYHRAETRALAGDYRDAVAGFETLAKHFPGHELTPQALFMAGELLESNLGEVQRALLDYLQLIRDYPRAPQAATARRRAAAIYRQHLKDYANALTLLQRLLESNPGDADRIRYQIGDCYFRLENYEQARIEFETLQKRHPASPLLPEVGYRIGMAYLLEGDRKGALRAFAGVIEKWPDNRFGLEAQFAMAGVFERQGELRRALRELQKLQGRYPEKEILRHRIDQVRRRMAKKKRAI